VKRPYGFLVVSLVLAAVLTAVATGSLNAATQGVYRLLGLVGQVLALVQSNYVEETDLDRLETGALSGLVESADPGGAWIPSGQAEGWAKLVHRRVPPFGLVLGMRSGYPVVIQVLPGSPAESAGLAPGELVERAGDRPARARPLWETALLLDAAERERRPIDLDVISRDLGGKRLVSLAEGAAAPPQPRLDVHEGVPVVRLAAVDDNALVPLRRLLDEHAAATAVVVDLTGTALGAPHAAPRLAAELIGGEVTVKWAGRDRSGTLTASAPGRPWRLLVCVDTTTAGPAEVLALALQARGAVLVGRETYGDTAERRAVGSDGGQLWLARTWFLMSDGSPLLGAGLKPDEPVRGRGDRNLILERALELARGEAPAKAA